MTTTDLDRRMTELRHREAAQQVWHRMIERNGGSWTSDPAPPLSCRVGRCHRCDRAMTWRPRRGFTIYDLACYSCGRASLRPTTRRLSRLPFMVLDDEARDGLYAVGLRQRIDWRRELLDTWRRRDAEAETPSRGFLIANSEAELADLEAKLAQVEPVS